MIKLKSLIYESMIKIDMLQYQPIEDDVITKYISLYKKYKETGYKSIQRVDGSYIIGSDTIYFTVSIMADKSFHGEYKNHSYGGRKEIDLYVVMRAPTKWILKMARSVFKHEFTHLVQLAINRKNNDDKTIKSYGTETPELRDPNYDKYGRPTKSFSAYMDKDQRQIHPLRSVEYKPLLSTYKDEIAYFMETLPKKYKKIIFGFMIGQYSHWDMVPIYEKHKTEYYRMEGGLTKRNLEILQEKDRPRWRQVVKELYGELF